MASTRMLQLFHNVRGGLHCSFDIRLTVRQGKEPGLELRWSQINPAVEHAVEISLKSLTVTGHRVVEIIDRSVGKITAEHRAASVELYWHLGRPGSLLQPIFKSSTKVFETV